MRKSVLSFANIEEESKTAPGARNQFAGLKLNELLGIRDEAIKSGNIRDYEDAIQQIMAEAPSFSIVKEFMDVMTERKDFKRLANFHTTHYQAITRIVNGEANAEWRAKLSHLLANAIVTKDPKIYREFKQLRSLLLFSPIKDNSNEYKGEIETRVAQAEDLISTTFAKSLVGNKQYERQDKTKTTVLPFVDVEVVTKTARGESHLLMLTDDNFVLCYGDNSKGQLLPSSGCETIDKATYLPSFESAFELLKAKHIFARENFSALLTVDNKLVMFGEGWTDKYVVVKELGNFDHIVVMKSEVLLIGEQQKDIIIINSSALKDYLLSETSSHKEMDDSHYSVDAENLNSKKIVRKLAKPAGEKIQKLTCGSNHMLLLAGSGRLYGYGANDKNQLCHSKRKSFEQITELSSTQGECIKSIFAFNDFSVAIDETGGVSVIGRISRNSKLIRATGVPRITDYWRR